MTDHFHVAIEPPKGNLVEGLQFWQGVFATRFNRPRDERGHIYPGRFKSLLVENFQRLGALCHYIHLNPVRAGICTAEDLPAWPWSSLAWMSVKNERPGWFSPAAALQHVGGLSESSEGYGLYFDYLAWLAQDATAQRELMFEKMQKGWVLGSDSFKKALIEDHEELKNIPVTERHELADGQSIIWQQLVDESMH